MTSMKVCVRFRPQNKIEKAKNAWMVTKFEESGTLVEIHHPDTKKYPRPLKFPFDRVFNHQTPQPLVFEYGAKSLVGQIFSGFNATIFAYGQTGAGKTYSMEGELGSPHRGLVPRIVETVFETIMDSDDNLEFLIKISYVEIYLEMLRDLLNPKNTQMKIRESKQGVYIQGVTEMYVRDAQEAMDLMTFGAGNRTVNSTGMNAVSSRSHGVFMLKLEQKALDTGTKKASKLFMVDLAGSEKISKTGASGQLLEEAKKINQSLSALGNVMNALSSGKGHVAYRDSVLTRLLSDALGGNCKTTLLIACSPSSYNVDETIGTLRFGQRAKKIKNKAKVNAEKTVAEYKKDVLKLKDLIKKLKAKNKKGREMIKALQTDLEASKNGTLVDGEGLYDKLLAGEKVDLKEDKKPEETKEEDTNETSQQPQQTMQMNMSMNMNTNNNSGNNNENVKIIEKVSGITKEMYDEAIKRAEVAEERAQDLEERLLSIKEHRNSIMPGKGMGMKLLSPNKQMQLNNILEEEEDINDNDEKDDKKDDETEENNEDDIVDKLLDFKQKEVTIDRKISIHQVMEPDEEDDGVEVDSEVESEEEIEIKTVSQITQLTPELIQEAQKELKMINKTLNSQIDSLKKEKLNLQTKIDVQKEKLLKLTDKFDEMELSCAKYMTQNESLQERLSGVDQMEHKYKIQNSTLEKKILKLNEEIEALKNQKDKMREDNKLIIENVRKVERERAKEIIREAENDIRKFRKNQSRNQYKGRQQNQGLGKLKDQSLQKMKSLNRKEQFYEKKMKDFEEETLRHLHSIRLEQLKLKQQLQTKIEETLSLETKLVEKSNDIKVMKKEVKSLKLKLKQKEFELSAFGKLKLETDKYHSQQAQKAEETIHKLKLSLKKLEQKNKESQFGLLQNNNMKQLGYPEPKNDVNSIMMMNTRQRIPVPLRGGKNQKNDKKNNNQKTNTLNTNKNGYNRNNYKRNNYNRNNYNNHNRQRSRHTGY